MPYEEEDACHMRRRDAAEEMIRKDKQQSRSA
jgi:hypothetical protein